ncbi:MAG: 3-dehydroquinate synthase [Terriglobales bacterium]
MRRISIRVHPRPYDVLIEHGLVGRAGKHLESILGRRARCFVVTTPSVRRRWGGELSASLKRAGVEEVVLEMGEGERYKTLATVGKLAEKLLRRGADRRSVAIAFGGGVVGDVTGFLASIYMRGLECVQIPTTLLAQVDAAIGGKTGVNLRAGKNLLGSFHQPRAVLVDPGVLATLPEREYRSGLYEALKCGVIRSPRLFEFMEQERERILERDPRALEWLIAECVQVKARVVAADERERGLRRILNFGHTIGHALEAETGYRRFRHGEAVAWGMVAASSMAAALGKLDAATARRITSAVLAYAPLPSVGVRSHAVVRRLAADKKTVDGVAHFVLPRAIGRVEIAANVPERVVTRAVEELRALSRA